jgi:hypothetical protein
MKRSIQRSLALSAVLSLAGIASAVTFSNISITNPPLSSGWSSSAAGNAISFFTPNAIVGDPVDPMRSGALNITYVADSSALMVANIVGVALGTALSGSGTVMFTETIWEADGLGNAIGTPIGTDNFLFTSSTSNVYSNVISLSKAVRRIKVLKTFNLDATTNTANLDLAALAIVNQNIQTQPVPEPATMAALGLGLAAVARRRKAR